MFYSNFYNKCLFILIGWPVRTLMIRFFFFFYQTYNIPLKYTASYIILGGTFFSTELTWVKNIQLGIIKRKMWIKSDNVKGEGDPWFVNTNTIAMGFNILRTTSISTPISSSKSKPIFSTLLRSSPSTIFPPKSVTPTTLFVSATPFFTLHPKLGFRGGIVAMAAPGSLRKSEEEWRAILSPEQFRILRQKGTE